jgi:hypothetical protein
MFDSAATFNVVPAEIPLDVALMVVLPAATACATPVVAFTVATPVLEDVQLHDDVMFFVLPSL